VVVVVVEGRRWREENKRTKTKPFCLSIETSHQFSIFFISERALPLSLVLALVLSFSATQITPTQGATHSFHYT
jgi:hypothetical protein